MINARPAAGVWVLAGAVALVQIVDIVLHAATNQLEFLRVASNLVVLAWVVFAVSGRRLDLGLPVAVRAIVVYFVLNAVFLSREGLTNPAQGGAPRLALLVLVGLTVALSLWLAVKQRRRT